LGWKLPMSDSLAETRLSCVVQSRHSTFLLAWQTQIPHFWWRCVAESWLACLFSVLRQLCLPEQVRLCPVAL
jgi:hypothetical protein